VINKVIKIISSIVFIALAFSANAGIFDGTTITYQYYFPNLNSPYTNASNGSYFVGTGGAGIANIDDGLGSMNIKGNELTLSITGSTTFSKATFNGFEITDTQANFASFSLLQNSAFLSGSPALTFDTHHLWVNFQSLTFTPGTLQLAVGTIPEPSSYAMLLTGLGLIGVISYRRKYKLSDMPIAV
jgi:hypothetical protein